MRRRPASRLRQIAKARSDQFRFGVRADFDPVAAVYIAGDQQGGMHFRLAGVLPQLAGDAIDIFILIVYNSIVLINVFLISVFLFILFFFFKNKILSLFSFFILELHNRISFENNEVFF